MTAPEREVTDEILVAGCDAQEALEILIRWFGGATGPCSDGSVWFPEAGSQARLRASHSQDGALRLFAGPAWDWKEAPPLSQRLQRDLTARKLVGCRQVIFSALPLNGWIRFGSTVQLRPRQRALPSPRRYSILPTHASSSFRPSTRMTPSFRESDKIASLET